MPPLSGVTNNRHNSHVTIHSAAHSLPLDLSRQVPRDYYNNNNNNDPNRNNNHPSSGAIAGIVISGGSPEAETDVLRAGGEVRREEEVPLALACATVMLSLPAELVFSLRSDGVRRGCGAAGAG
ncbi:Uu.00g056550.m01.CDS01 [Anthostomella pinea]|uniref:Uu.00g056550.m01.CDS01 n=1 Tax=Anthostomella pinea TaxID=933095 RepID=A0AAI8YM76_9PEZI|nr:Uu.00g056550.m01.CDS01 [Anthostomella pinea]